MATVPALAAHRCQEIKFVILQLGLFLSYTALTWAVPPQNKTQALEHSPKYLQPRLPPPAEAGKGKHAGVPCKHSSATPRALHCCKAPCKLESLLSTQSGFCPHSLLWKADLQKQYSTGSDMKLAAARREVENSYQLLTFTVPRMEPQPQL